MKPRPAAGWRAASRTAVANSARALSDRRRVALYSAAEKSDEFRSISLSKRL
jgi:hypothetical protein